MVDYVVDMIFGGRDLCDEEDVEEENGVFGV